MNTKAKLVFVVTEDWYFCTHRLPLALAAQEAGYQVTVITRNGEYAKCIKEAGLELVPFDFNRSSINIFIELFTLWKLGKILMCLKPDVLHNVALKPVIYGSICGKLFNTPVIVNAVSGLGHVFAKKSWFRHIIKFLLRSILPKTQIIVQNTSDAGVLAKLNYHLFQGVGVDTKIFHPVPEPEGRIKILLASRMLWSKGVGEFIAAAKQMKNQNLEFILAGPIDVQNPDFVPLKTIQEWQKEGIITYLGRYDLMAELYQTVHIVVLPTYYGEGVPKTLLEAMSCGKPIITTKMPGCQDVVHDGINGILIEPKNTVALINALNILIENPNMRKTMGHVSRNQAIKDYNQTAIIARTLNLYAG